MWRKLYFIMFLAAVAVLPTSAFAIGCVSGPDNWFNATIKIDPTSLPAGVVAESFQDYGYPSVILTNSTAVPLTVKALAHDGWPRPMKVKFVSGEGYYCFEQIGCEKREKPRLFTEEIDSLLSSKVFISRDDRPQDVKVPEPQNFQFPAQYGDQQILIRGTVSYSLNDKYNPKREEQTRQMCEQSPSAILYRPQSIFSSIFSFIFNYFSSSLKSSDHGAGGIAITSVTNCASQKFAIRSKKVIAETMSNPIAQIVPQIAFQVSPAVGYLPMQQTGTASSAIHVTAEGPILDSIASTQVTTRIDCTEWEVQITADIWQSEKTDAEHEWKSAGYTGNFAKETLWRPAYDFNLVTSTPSVPLHFEWKLHDKNGALLSQTQMHGVPEQNFPLILDKEITGGELRQTKPDQEVVLH